MQSQAFQGPVNYGHSSQGGPVTTPVEGAVYSPHIEGNLVREKIKKTDDFTQAKERYRSMSKTEMKHLVENLKKTDEGLGRGVAVGLGLEKQRGKRDEPGCACLAKSWIRPNSLFNF